MVAEQALTQRRTHPALSGLTEDGIRSEVTQVEDAFVNLIGKKPAYIRPPYLDTAGQTLPVLKAMGYKVITDDVDSEDWNGHTPAQSEQAFLTAGPSGNGHIPLMHEPYNATVHELTPWLINWAKENNLKLVTVGEFAALGFLDRTERASTDNRDSRVPGRSWWRVPEGPLRAEWEDHLLRNCGFGRPVWRGSSLLLHAQNKGACACTSCNIFG